MNSLKNKQSRGFTLIELLVVIAILAFMSSVVLSNVTKARRNAKDVQRKTDLRQLQVALEQYYLDNGKYPTTKPNPTGNSIRWLNSKDCPSNWIPGLVPKYISSLPKEPDQSATLCMDADIPYTGDLYGTSYRYKSDGTSYKVHAHYSVKSPAMLNPNDPFYHCGGTQHAGSWSVCGGPVPCQTLWCTASADNDIYYNGCM